MRNQPPDFSAEMAANGSWSLKSQGAPVAASVPLERLIGRIESPVSIIATGPTARDYRQQAGRFVVAVNGAPALLAELGIRPDLLVVTDPRVPRAGSQHFQKAEGVPLVTTFNVATVLAMQAPAELTSREFSIIERINGWYGIPAVSQRRLDVLNQDAGLPFHFHPGEKLKHKVGWSDVPQLGFFSGCTVVFAALQVLVRLGAKDIEIVGMDLSGAGRAYHEGDNPQPSALVEQYQEFILPSFEVMHLALKDSGVKVRNISPVCPLPKEFFSHE
jgi:Kdo-III transferase WaaZ